MKGKLFLTNLIAIFFLLNPVLSQKSAFDIKFKIIGLENEPLVIAYRYGDNQYIKDTIKLNDKGFGEYKGTEALAPGVYLGVVPSMNNNYFEFIVKEQFFSLETDKKDMSLFMKVTGSKENKIFYDDLQFISKMRKEAEPLSAKLKTMDASSDSAKALSSKLGAIDKEVKSYRESMIKEYPDALYSKIMKALKEIDIPESPKDAAGRADSTFPYRFYKSHYWDNVDFSEEGLLRSPVYHNKLDNYFEKVVIGVPDSIIPECDYVLKKTRANKELFKYSLVYLLNRYASSKIMGMDAVYVHLVDDYYGKGEAYWMKNDSVSLYKMIVSANKTRPLLIGQVAPNLTLPDTTSKSLRVLHDINSKYTILVFWDPDCGHCKKEIPELARIYDKLQKLGATVYAVSTISYEEMDKWKNFIKDNKCNWINVADPYFQFNPNFRTVYDITSTPVIYVLDKDKIIRAKRIGVDQLEDFIIKYEEFLKSKSK